MQDTEAVDAQLRDQVWTYAQRGVIVLVFFLAGLLLGYRFWGKAGELQEQVEELTERNQSLTKERDTERSRVTLIERDKKELERLLEEAKGAAAAARGESGRGCRGERERHVGHGIRPHGAGPAVEAGPQQPTGRNFSRCSRGDETAAPMLGRFSMGLLALGAR